MCLGTTRRQCARDIQAGKHGTQGYSASVALCGGSAGAELTGVCSMGAVPWLALIGGSAGLGAAAACAGHRTSARQAAAKRGTERRWRGCGAGTGPRERAGGCSSCQGRCAPSHALAQALHPQARSSSTCAPPALAMLCTPLLHECWVLGLCRRCAASLQRCPWPRAVSEWCSLSVSRAGARGGYLLPRQELRPPEWSVLYRTQRLLPAGQSHERPDACARAGSACIKPATHGLHVPQGAQCVSVNASIQCMVYPGVGLAPRAHWLALTLRSPHCSESTGRQPCRPLRPRRCPVCHLWCSSAPQTAPSWCAHARHPSPVRGPRARHQLRASVPNRSTWYGPAAAAQQLGTVYADGHKGGLWCPSGSVPALFQRVLLTVSTRRFPWRSSASSCPPTAARCHQTVRCGQPAPPPHSRSLPRPDPH